MDQLGSGIRKVTHYIGAYANGQAAQFIEGDVFRTIIPLDERLVPIDSQAQAPGRVNRGKNRASSSNDAANDIINLHDAVNDAVNDAVKPLLSDAIRRRLQEQVRFILRYGGITLGKPSRMCLASRARPPNATWPCCAKLAWSCSRVRPNRAATCSRPPPANAFPNPEPMTNPLVAKV